MKAPIGGASLMDDPVRRTRRRDRENELVALNTQLRVSGGGRRTNPTRPVDSQAARKPAAAGGDGAHGGSRRARALSGGRTFGWSICSTSARRSICGGSNEVQRSIISSTILGL